MKGLSRTVALMAALLFGLQPLWAVAGAGPTLVPQGKVKLLGSGTVVDTEMPVPEGMLMACSGRCMVEANGFQLVGADKTVFAVQEEADRWVVMVQEGTVDFAIRVDGKPVTFRTPFDTAETRPYAQQAATDSVIRGTLRVTKERAVLSMTEGSLQLMSSSGRTVVDPGNAVVLAQAEVGAAAGGALGMSGAAIGAAAVGTAAIITGAAVAANEGGDGGGQGEASPY